METAADTLCCLMNNAEYVEYIYHRQAQACHCPSIFPKDAPSSVNGGYGPPSNTWFPGPHKPTSKTVSQLVQQFCRSRQYVQQTDRHTHRPQNIGDSGPHLMLPGMRTFAQ